MTKSIITQRWRDSHPAPADDKLRGKSADYFIIDDIGPETTEIVTLDELGQLSPGQRAAVIRRQQSRFDANGNDGRDWPDETHDPD